MTIAVILYNMALTFPYQVDATNSKSSYIIYDNLVIIVPDQKIYILLNIKQLQFVSAEEKVTSGIWSH